MNKILMLFFVCLLVSCSMEFTRFEPRDESCIGYYVSNRRTFSEVVSIAQRSVMMIEDNPDNITRSAMACRSLNLINGVKCITSSSVTRSGITSPDTLLYVFNCSDDKGFVIISANRNISPIIAIVEHGNYNPDVPTGNPAFDDYMLAVKQYVSEEDSKLQEEDISAMSNSGPAYAMYRPFYDTIMNRTVSPKIPVRWGQTAMIVRGTDHSYSGCGPTAVAQIMSAFGYPTMYNEYLFTADSVISVNNTPWTQMVDSSHRYTCFNKNDVDDGDKAIINIAYELGRRSNSTYSNTETVTTINDLRNATMSYGFCCDPIVQHDKDNIIDFSVLTLTLSSDKLICMLGSNSSDGSVGHFYVIDGCKYINCNYSIKGSNDGVNWYADPFMSTYNRFYHTELMHINWGWDGHGNGYFDYNVLNASLANSYDSADENVNPAYNISSDANYSRNLQYFTIYR